MRVFLTGATGFIGSRIVPELLAYGHEVLGLTRSTQGARKLEASGAEPVFGDIEDVAGLCAGVARAEAVIHTAFDHDFSNFVANCEKDRRVILAMGEVLKGSDRPFLITSGVGMGSTTPGAPALEAVFDRSHANPRIASEEAGEALKAGGVNVIVIRLPQVHDTVRQGLISPIIELTRAKGMSAYVGDGATRFSAAHVSDVARLYRLALEKGAPNGRYNAVAEEGLTMRAIAETIGQGLGLPVASLSQDEATEHFGWLSAFVTLDMAASGAWTQNQLDWRPTGPDLLTDLRDMEYSAWSSH